jgi:hypothetical protein
MTFRKKSSFILPVSLVKDLNPLGHSGHFRLQAVVGSIDIVIGVPHCTGRPDHFVHWYEDQINERLTALDHVTFDKNLRVSAK